MHEQKSTGALRAGSHQPAALPPGLLDRMEPCKCKHARGAERTTARAYADLTVAPIINKLYAAKALTSLARRRPNHLDSSHRAFRPESMATNRSDVWDEIHGTVCLLPLPTIQRRCWCVCVMQENSAPSYDAWSGERVKWPSPVKIYKEVNYSSFQQLLWLVWEHGRLRTFKYFTIHFFNFE